MSIRKTREELRELDSTKVASILPSVYEFRFVKLVILDNTSQQALWIYMGRSSDYLIVPGYFCSCMDFMVRTVINKTSPYCKHLAGVQIAMKAKKYAVLHVDVEESAVIIAEILENRFSSTLRKLLSRGKQTS
ncbi:MAG: hypothetical protein QXI85_00730 [Desulfurococcaceae archaeon]